MGFHIDQQQQQQRSLVSLRAHPRQHYAKAVHLARMPSHVNTMHGGAVDCAAYAYLISKYVRVPGTPLAGRHPPPPPKSHASPAQPSPQSQWRFGRCRHECERALAVWLALEPAALVHRAAAVLTPGEGEGGGVREGEGKGGGGGEGNGERAKARARARRATTLYAPRPSSRSLGPGKPTKELTRRRRS